MKVVAIIVNIFFPGAGTLLVGKIGTGVTQIVLTIVAALMTYTAILSIVGVPLAIGVWIWALVSVAKSDAPDTIVTKEVIREVPAKEN